METRDRLFNAAHFSQQLVHYDALSQEALPSSLSGDRLLIMLYIKLDHAFRGLVCAYSRGDPLNTLIPRVDSWIDLLRQFSLAMNTERPNLHSESHKMWGRLTLPTLYEGLSILAFMLAFRYPREQLCQMLIWFGHEGKEPLLDIIRSFVLEGKRLVQMPERVTLRFSKIYTPLVALWQADPDERSRLLAVAMHGWYRRMRAIYWYNAHRAAQHAYFGYWAFDVALVVMLLDIDDCTVQCLVKQHAYYKKRPYYPVDLVNFYRAAIIPTT